MAVIPSQNPIALVAYYLGILSLVPFLGFVLGLPALICGIVGGKGHAWTGIVLGVLGPFIGIGILILLGVVMWFLSDTSVGAPITLLTTGGL